MPSAIEEAIAALGFSTFEDFVVSRSGDTLRDMARELGVSEQTFIVYHSRWIDEQAQQGAVAPLRLED